MGNRLKTYVKEKIYLAYDSILKKNTEIYLTIITRFKKIKSFFVSTYYQYLCNKFVRLGMICPMFLILLSGFIEDKTTSVSGSLSYSREQLYPLTQNFLPIAPLPNSGMTPISYDKSRFFAYSVKSHPSSSYRDKTKKNITANAKPNSFSQRKKSYTVYAKSYARKYGLDPNMVIAIIYAESLFLPHVVSNRNAHGLMQIVPSTAGAEVHRFFKKQGEPSSMELMHPETNIRYGTAYLYLLRRYHLVGIKDQKNKNILTIASYNAGSGAVLRHFARNRSKAIERVNKMTPDAVLATILTSYRSRETRKYVKKVLTHMGGL